MARSLGNLTVDLLLKTSSFETDAGRAAKIADKRAKQIDESFQKAGKAIGVAIGVGVTVAATALAAWTRDVIQAGDQIVRLSRLSSAGVVEFQKFAAAAARVGVEQDKLGDIFKDTQDKIGDFIATGGGELQKFFTDIAPKIGVTADQFLKLSGPQALQLFYSTLEKANVSQKEMVFHLESIADEATLLQPLLKNNGQALKEYGDQAQRLGGIMSAETIAAMADMRGELWELQQVFKGVKVQVVSGVIEPMQDLTELLSDPETVQTMVDTAGLILDIAGAAVKAAKGIGGLINSYKSFLADRGFMPVDEGSTDAQLEARRERLKALLSADAAGRGVWGPETMAALRSEVYEINKILNGGPLAQSYMNLPWYLGGEQEKPFSAIEFRAVSPRSPAVKTNDDAAASEKRLADAKRDAANATAEKLRLDREAEQAARELTAAQSDAQAQLEDWRAELAGPAAQARLQYTRMEEKAEQQVMSGVLTMYEYVDALEMIGEMRDRDVALIPEWVKAQQRAAEQFEWMWDNAIMSVGDAFGDWMTGGLNSFEDFGDALVDITQRFISDIISEFASGQLRRVLANWGSQIASGMSGGGMNWGQLFGMGGGSGGGWMSKLSTVYNGFTNGFSAAGAAGSGFWGSLVSGFGGAVSAFTGSLGTATAATGSYGAMLNGLSASWGVGGTGVAGGFAANGGVATAGVGAAAGVSWIPIVGWIIAGMMMNDAAFKQGWRIDGQKSDMTEYYLGKGLLGAGVATATVGATDQLLRSLGLNDRWASLISGSSLHTKIWGHQQPRVQSTGIEGTAGLGGFDGQAFANIKAEGGWFRSDDWWQEFGEIDSSIDRAFDAAALQIGTGAEALAKQLGVDLSAAFAAIEVDIDQLKLDEDPEKARQQIQEAIEQVMADLAAGAVAALGFGRLLDDGFAATEVMGALQASIALVTGGAEKLGRALTDLEKENVARAVEWIGGLATANGTSLGQELQRVLGTIGQYTDLIGGIDRQLRTADLNAYQRAQLDIEMNYRAQVKQANELAKSLGLTGARAEDLAKIEQLRALNMASLQTAMEAQKDTFLQDLGLGELSTLRDDQKLAESMQLLRDAVGAGDIQRAQQLAQDALGLGRDLYASGADYADLYGTVTGLIDGMGAGDMAGFTDGQLDHIADILTDLPGNIASALFNTLYDRATLDGPNPWTPPPPVQPPPGGGLPPGVNPGRPGKPGDVATMARLLQSMSVQLDAIAANTGGSLQQSRSDSLNNGLNAKVRA